MNPSPKTPIPFTDDLDYLEANLELVRARCDRLRAAREHAENHARRSPSVLLVGDAGVAECPEYRRIVGPLKANEDQLRESIDARVAANAETGPELTFEVVATRHELDEVDRAALWLAVLPIALGEEAAGNLLDGVGGSGRFYSLTADVLAGYCELDLRARLGLRRRFLPGGRLIDAGLMTADTRGDLRPDEWPGTSFHLTDAGLAAIVGRLPTSTSTSTRA